MMSDEQILNINYDINPCTKSFRKRWKNNILKIKDINIRAFFKKKGFDLIKIKKPLELDDDLLLEICEILTKQNTFNGVDLDEIIELVRRLPNKRYFVYNDKYAFFLIDWNQLLNFDKEDEERFKRLNWMILDYGISNKKIKTTILYRDYTFDHINAGTLEKTKVTDGKKEWEEEIFFPHLKTTLLIKDEDGNLKTGEEIAINYYKNKGYNIIYYSTNEYLFESLFSSVFLLFNDAGYYKSHYIEKSYINKFKLILNKYNNLNDFFLDMLKKAREGSTQRNDFYDKIEKKHKSYLKSILNTIKKEDLIKMFELNDGGQDRWGFPDLFVWNEKTGEYFFSEVKTKDDKLGTHQKRWIQKNINKLNFKFEIVRILNKR